MKPQYFEGVTKVFTAPGLWNEEKYGPCGELPVKVEAGVLISCWKPRIWEVLQLLFGGRVYLRVVSAEQPPVALEVV